MKIAIISSGHVPSEYAHSINTVKHAYAFSKLGCEVELLCVTRFREEELLKKIKDIYEWYGIERITIKYFRDKSIFYYQEKPVIGKFIKALNKLTFGYFKQFFDPEKVISEYIIQNKFDFCFGRSYRIVPYNMENKMPTIIESHNPSPFKNHELLKAISFHDNLVFKGIVTIHDDLKNNFLNLGMDTEKVLVQEDAVDLDLFEEVNNDMFNNRHLIDLPCDKKIVMYSGSLKRGKGIHIILDIAKCFQDNQDILFVLVGGSNEEVKNWKGYYDGDNVLYRGFQKGNIIPYYLKSADVLIMPYDLEDKKMVMDINTTSPIKLFEYMGSNVPIISTDIPVVRKVVQHNREALLASKFDDYIVFIEKVLSDNELANNLASSAYTHVKRYTYKKRCRNILENLYKVK